MTIHMDEPFDEASHAASLAFASYLIERLEEWGKTLQVIGSLPEALRDEAFVAALDEWLASDSKPTRDAA